MEIINHVIIRLIMDSHFSPSVYYMHSACDLLYIEYSTNSACMPNDEVDIVNNHVYPLVWIPGCSADDKGVCWCVGTIYQN